MDENNDRCRGMCLEQCCCDCYDCDTCKKTGKDCDCDERKSCEFCERLWEDCQCDESKFVPSTITWHASCTCGHRNHKGYHKTPDSKCKENCAPILCPNDANHNISGGYFAQVDLDVHGGNCIHCAMQYGHDFKHEAASIEKCCVCFEKKEMTTLRCAHRICWKCWETICKNELGQTRASCPLCRTSKW